MSGDGDESRRNRFREAEVERVSMRQPEGAVGWQQAERG